MAKKLQRSMSKENAAETAAAMVEAERDRRNRKSATPPKQREDKTPSSGKQRTPAQGKSAAASAKKKLTMEDLEDDAGSDADWSDVETPNRSEDCWTKYCNRMDFISGCADNCSVHLLRNTFSKLTGKEDAPPSSRIPTRRRVGLRTRPAGARGRRGS